MLSHFFHWLIEIAIAVWSFPYPLLFMVARDMLAEPLGAASAVVVIGPLAWGAARMLRSIGRSASRSGFIRPLAAPLALAGLAVALTALSMVMGSDPVAYAG